MESNQRLVRLRHSPPMRRTIYFFGVVAIVVSLDSILFGGSHTRMVSDGEHSIFKFVVGFFY